MKKYFLVKVKVETITEKGKVKVKVKKITEQYLICAEDVKSAESIVAKCGLIYDEISSISETKILDVLPEN